MVSKGVKKPKKGSERKGFLQGSIWTPFLLLLFLFLGLKTLAFNYAISDENNLFYFGKLISEGRVPYRDFFFSHPPLGIMVNGLIFGVFGFNLVILKSVAILSVAGASVFLFLTVLEAFGRTTAIIASATFLFSYVGLRVSSHPMGSDLAVLFMSWSLYMFWKGRYLQSGLLVGVACMSGLYSAALAGAYVIFFLLRRRDVAGFAAPLLGGFIIVFASFNVLLYVLIGQPYLDGVYLYHFHKPVFEGHNLATFLDVVKSNPLLFLPLLGIPLIMRKPLVDDLSVLLVLSVACFAVFFSLMNTIFDHYFLLVAPFAAAVSARVLGSWIDSTGDKGLFRIVVGLIVIMSSWAVLAYYVHESYYSFVTADPMADYINSKTGPGDEVFGDSMSAPLIALLAGRRIALDEADTNIQRFSGTTDIREFLGRLEQSPMKTVIVSPPPQGVTNIPEVRSFLMQRCKAVKQFDEPFLGNYTILRCS
ncbi:MAG: glycosyltransferase family 39 protein [Candidatus Altiarchaeota archaeon]